jgi:peptidoglycan/LPS O-acetylase OafA/YrhL
MTDHAKYYREDIDGLRALAITSVIFYHANFSVFSGGFVGVDVFFVISGFLITRLLASEILASGTLSFSRFYGRRMKRLLPPLVVVLVATLLLWEFFVPGVRDEIGKLSASARYSVFGLGNIYFLKNTDGYFDGNANEKPLLHLWSLGVEEQFYFVWPWVIFLAYRIKQQLKHVLLLAILIWILSFVGAHQYLSLGKKSEAFYLPGLRAWELMTGAIVALSGKAFLFEKEISKTVRNISATIGLTGILLPILIYRPNTPFPGLSALPVALGTALIIAAGPRAFLNQLFSNTILVKIGLISYGWYLWHWPLLAIYRKFSPDESLWTVTELVLVSGIFAYLTYFFVETPVRKNPLFNRAPHILIAAGIICSLLICTLYFSFVRLDERIAKLRYGNRYVNCVRKVDQKHFLYNLCFVPGPKGTDFSSCYLSHYDRDLDRNTTIAVMGNSHAMSFFPLIENYAKYAKVDAVEYAKVSYYLPAWPISKAVDEYNTNVLDDLRKRAEESAKMGGKVSVFLASRFALFMTPQFSDQLRAKSQNAAPDSKQAVDIKEKLENSIVLLLKNGISRILLALPFPEFQYDALKCFRWFFPAWQKCMVTRKDMELYRKPVVDILRSAAAIHPQVRVFDSASLICNDISCPEFAEFGQEILSMVTDDNHPTEAAMRNLSPEVKNELDWLSGKK